jgi:hypothetical protein
MACRRATRVHESTSAGPVALDSVLVFLSSDNLQTVLLSFPHALCFYIHSFRVPALPQVTPSFTFTSLPSFTSSPPASTLTPACWHVLAHTCSSSHLPSLTQDFAAP